MQGLRPGVGRPLLTPRARRWAGALLACSAFVVAVLGVLVAHQTQPGRFDRGIDAPVIAWFGDHPGLGLLLAAPGSLVPAAVLTMLVVIGCLLARRINGALLALVSVTVAIGLDERVFKPLFGRTYLGFPSYPSGHTTAVFALSATVTVLLLVRPQPGRHRGLRIAVTAASGLLGCVVAAALIGLRWHYFTDTVAGAAVGIGTVCGVAMLLDLPRVRRRFWRAAPDHA